MATALTATAIADDLTDDGHGLIRISDDVVLRYAADDREEVALANIVEALEDNGYATAAPLTISSTDSFAVVEA